jgi:hypothetical protein
MAWNPPSDAVETQASPAPAVNTGWTPPSDAVEVGIELRNPNSITADEYRAQVAAREAKGYDRTISGTALDAGITFLKGAIGLPEAFVGLADIPTLGRAGKLLEQAGYKPKEAKEILDTYLSEAQQFANRQVKETKGFLPTIGAVLKNPSTIATTVGESLPQMLGGAGIARGVLKVAPKVAPYLAGAAGEGLLGAGSAAEQMRQDAKDGLLTGKQALSAVGSGVGTAAFGVAGGKLAKKFGLDDIDTMLVGGAKTATGSKSVVDFAKRATASGISEGVFEEMPQSMQEKMWMNYATDKPLMDGVAEAAGMGLVTGATMGVGATALGGRRRESPPAAPIPPTGERIEPTFEPEKFETPPPVTDKRQALKDALADKIRALAGPSAEETNAPTQEGAKDVTEPISQAGGEGPALSAQPADNVPPAAGVGGVERDGVVPAGQDVTEPAAGEGTQPAAITAEEDYANKSLEELENLRSTADQTNDALDITSVRKHFGPEVAATYEKMSRGQRNRWWNENATEALDRDASTFNGINEDLLDEYIKAHNNFDTESPNLLGRSVGLLARKINDPRFVGSPEFVTLKNALAYAKQQGFSEAEVLGGMRERASEWAGADAQELFKDLFKAKPPETKTPKLEPAATDEEYIPFYGEDLTNKPAPTRLEIQELERQQEEASKAVEKLSKRTAGTSLFKVLQGSLKNSEMSELGGRSRQVGKNPFMSLVAKKGKPGSSMEDMVDSGALDLFLPEKMRPESPMYDNQESAAYIREKLIQGQYYTYETQMEIDRVTRGIEDLDKLIQEELSIDDINKEIQLAFDEQREADLDAAQAVPQGEAGSAAKGEGAEAESGFLKTQTAEELKAKQAEIDRLTKENERLAKEAERKAKADEQAGDFVLTGSEREADQAAARGQKDIFAEAPAAEPETVAISTEQERKEALEQFKRQLSVPITPFYAKSAGKTQYLKPAPLTNAQIKEILKLASDALDLGMPAAVLGNITAGGSTRMRAAAIMSARGELMTGSQWKTASPAEKLQALIHELGHSIDFLAGKISNKADWSKAHTELQNWYANSANKFQHPLAYPFSPKFKGRVRPEMESFAQAFGYYFTSPADLQKNAPEAYSQIQAIVERIQDGSQKARAAGTTERGTAAINVQPSRVEKNTAVQPNVGRVSTAVSATEGLEDRGSGEVEAVEINASISPEEKEKSTWIFGRDRLGRVGFGPGAIAYRTVADIANKVLDKIAMKPISPELSRAMKNMKAKVELAKNKVAEVASEMNTLSPEEREMISDVIEGELKAGANPPQHILNIAAAIQSMMSRQSKELVDLGMLSKEAANRWDNKYLPRFYERQLKDSVNAWSKAAKEVFMKQPLMRGIRGSNLRSRGLYEVVGVDDLPNWLSEGWEQRDPKFDPKKSVETVVWRDYTREERENMGEIRDAMFRFVMGYNASQRDIALGRLYKDLAKNYASLSPLDGYVHVPTGNAEGTGAARYGALEGMYVPKEIMDHLSANDHAMAEGILKIYRAGLSKWKEGKTVLNPVSHANNVISNVTMAHFAGVSYWDAHKYAGAIKDLAKNDDMVKEAQEVGLFGGTFSQADLIKSMPPELRAMANLTESALSRFGERIWDTLAFTIEVGGKKFGARPVMQWAYENEDLFFRYVIYRDARNRGMNPEDARDYSQQFIFTYDDLPKGARLLRDYGMPFFSYTYKIVPVLAQTALKYPWRYAAPATVAYTANAMMYAIAANLGGDDDDWWGKVLYKYITDEEFRKKAKDLEANERRYLPEWMKGHSAILSTPKAIRMGVDEATNLPMFLDISRIFPGGDLLDANNNSGGVALIQPLTPSNPVLTSLVAMLGNKDLFLGKDVTNKTDTDEEKAAKRASWLWKQVTPAISVGNYHFDRAMNATANMTGKPITIDAGPLGVTSYTGIGKDGLPVQPKHAMLQTMGIKIRPYDLEIAKVFEENSKRALVREIDFAISKIKRQEAKGVISPEAAEIERQKLKDKKANVKQGLKLSGEEKE